MLGQVQAQVDQLKSQAEDMKGQAQDQIAIMMKDVPQNKEEAMKMLGKPLYFAVVSIYVIPQLNTCKCTCWLNHRALILLFRRFVLFLALAVILLSLY